MVKIQDIHIGNGSPTVLIAGPCAIESHDIAFETASRVKEIANRLGIPYIFKGSFDKANRMSAGSERGVGIDKGLEILSSIRQKLSLPVLTDIHEAGQADEIAAVVDCLQIPAFLCRQTDLVVQAAKTGKPINIKKGQFMSPADMIFIAEKVISTGNNDVMLTERGTSFGYGDIILDPRSLVIMKESLCPVILDVTHTTQKPGAGGGKSGGDRKFTPYFIKLGITFGVDAIYIETHPNPQQAISDKESQIPLDSLEELLRQNFFVNPI